MRFKFQLIGIAVVVEDGNGQYEICKIGKFESKEGKVCRIASKSGFSLIKK